MTYYQEKLVDDALKQFQTAYNFDPDFPGLRDAYATALVEKGLKDTAASICDCGQGQPKCSKNVIDGIGCSKK